MASLQRAFAAFALFGGKKDAALMDSAAFMKCVRDAGLLEKASLAAVDGTRLPSATDVDLIFTECKLPSRKIDLKAFRKALDKLATKMEADPAKVKAAVAEASPRLSGTLPENDELLQRMTDTKLYTGTHKQRFDEEGRGRGLAGAVFANDPISDLSQITDRKSADVRGVSSKRSSNASLEHETAAAGGGSGRSSREPSASPEKARSPPKDRSPAHSPEKSPVGSGALHRAFLSYAGFGKAGLASEMDSAAFAKLMRDGGFLAKKFTTTDVDLIFTQCKLPSRKVDFAAFVKALEMVAAQLELDADKVKDTVADASPRLSGTLPENDELLRRMTDTKLYTGTHKQRFDEEGRGRGIAGRTQHDKISDLSELTDRSSADVRGRKVE